MRIALGQINPTVGDLAGNLALCTRFARDAAERGADVLVFPELCVTGYPPRDLVEKRTFIPQSEAALARLNQAMALAEAERMKMQTLDENEHTAVAAKMMKREQSRMDELGVMLFNRLSHS